MKILHISSDYFNTKIYENLINNLNQYNHSIVFVPTKKNNNIVIKNENIYVSKIFNSLDRYFFYYKQKKLYNNIEKFIINKRPDIIHAHYLFTNGYSCMKIYKKYNIPYIVAIRNTDINFFLKYRFDLRKTGLKIMLNAKKIIFINNCFRDIVINKFVPKKFKTVISNKSLVIPNGIDDYWLKHKFDINDRLVQYKKKEEKKVNIITVGDICKNKNQLIVAKVVHNLSHKYKYNFTYELYGNIMDEKYFKKISHYHFVKYYGVLSKEELLYKYRNNDLFILISKHETFGLVYAEAITQRLPIIYSSNQGFDGFFEDGSVGFSVKHNDIKALENKIIQLLKNYNNIIRNDDFDNNLFDWAIISKTYNDIYNEVLSGDNNAKN